jgi:hypothetical protein
LQIQALCSDFAVQSASEFNDLQQNSLHKGTGNFLKVSGKIFWVTGNSRTKAANPTPDQYFDHTR